jgi:NADH-quinone oxidoreductase subunit M
VAITVLTLAAAIGAWGEFSSLGIGSASDPWDIGRLVLGRNLLVIDELSAPLLPLGALLYLLTTITTLRTKIRRFSFPLALLSLALLVAALSCAEPWAVVGLLSVSTIPPYLELRARRKPTRVYALHMSLFVVLLIAGWSWIAAYGSEQPPWWATTPLIVAVLIRCGIAPFHCWVTDLFEHATFGRALLFLVPMLGPYAAVRLLLPVAPTGELEVIGMLALATAVYAAGMALVQREARRFFAYIFLSHSALVVVGLDTVEPIGLTGALCVWLSVGLSLAGFGLTLRLLEARHGRLSLVGYHGLYEHTPLLAICFLLTGMASVGFPGTFGFLGSELLVDGAVQSYPFVGVAVIVAAALNGIAVMKAYFTLFTGTRHVSSVPLGIGTLERLAVLSIALLILGGGLFPQSGVASRHHAAEALLQQRSIRVDDDDQQEDEDAADEERTSGRSP